MTITADPDVLAAYWDAVRPSIPDAPAQTPEAWAFGATVAHADDLLALVLDGIKTGTASAYDDYAADDEPLPQVGDLSIILDGAGTPRAVLRVTALAVVPFDEVTEEHAFSEGEDDRTLRSWREIHERFWTQHGTTGFSPTMPVLCERFAVVAR